MIEPLSRLIPCRAVSGTNVEVVRRCLSAIEAGEVEFVVGMLDPNVEVTPSSVSVIADQPFPPDPAGVSSQKHR